MVRWRGSHLPAPGPLVDVELDVSDVLEWGVSLALLDGTPTRDEHGVPAGAVEAIDDDVVTVRIAGGIVLLEVVGEPPPTVVGRTVVLRGVPLEAWPTQI